MQSNKNSTLWSVAKLLRVFWIASLQQERFHCCVTCWTFTSYLFDWILRCSLYNDRDENAFWLSRQSKSPELVRVCARTWLWRICHRAKSAYIWLLALFCAFWCFCALSPSLFHLFFLFQCVDSQNLLFLSKFIFLIRNLQPSLSKKFTSKQFCPLLKRLALRYIEPFVRLTNWNARLMHCAVTSFESATLFCWSGVFSLCAKVHRLLQKCITKRRIHFFPLLLAMRSRCCNLASF